MRPFLALLTQEEHARLLKLGMQTGFASHGVNPDKGDAMAEKIAEEGGTMVHNALNTAWKMSLIAGIPIGAAWHILGRMSSADDRAEQEQRARIKYYSDVGKSLQHGIASPVQPEHVV